jgi:N6-adenosine-specific RNA methylase IME4
LEELRGGRKRTRTFDPLIKSPVGRHSEKPIAAYEIIERTFPALPKIELFARTQRSGWSAWGNEVGTEA